MSEQKGYPTREEAEKTLIESSRTNPGNWVPHSRYVAQAAQHIAAAYPGMDAEKAYVVGLLHDIGRQVGIVRARHQIEGYRFCMERGWMDCAKICLTHSHPLHNIHYSLDQWDTPQSDFEFVKHYVETAEYDDYDLLIQLCDSLARATGFCILEVRMVDVGRRYGVGPNTVKRWNKTFELKEYFDHKAGCNIYTLLPGIKESVLLS